MKRLLVIFAVLVLLAVAATVAGILLSERPSGTGLGGPTVLVWRAQGQLPERAQPDLFALPSGIQRPSLASLYRGLRTGLDEPEVKGLAIYIQNAGFGFAKAEELRRQLAAYTAAGKFVECYFETVGEGTNGSLAYFLASACDHIHLAPIGSVNLLGLYSSAPFFRGALDKLQIEPQFFTSGEYKSAGESYTRKDFSEPAKEALSALFDGWYDLLVQGIAAGRDLEPERVRQLIDGAPYAAQEAVDAGLIDDLLYPDQFRDRIDQLAGGAAHLVRLQGYGQSSGFGGGRRLAVVFAQGTIVRGTGGSDPWTDEVSIGSDDLSETLRDLRDDSSVPAVVLRIDSPGGSALASDLILREVELLAAQKPVVVSMSDLAASGGYYIAAKATKIVAEPGTITGSIGVITGRFATSGLEENLLGVTRDGVARGAHAGLWNDPRPMDDERAALVRKTMAPIYDAFVHHVSEGRGMSVEEVDAVARGRVWLGRDAQRLGLVDELGGLDRAIALAREQAGIDPSEELRLAYYPAPRSWLELFVEDRQPLLPASLRALAKRLKARAPGVLELPPELAELPTTMESN